MVEQLTYHRTIARFEVGVSRGRFETSVQQQVEAKHLADAQKGQYKPVDLTAFYNEKLNRFSINAADGSHIMKQPGAASLFYHGVGLWDMLDGISGNDPFFVALHEAVEDAQRLSALFGHDIAGYLDIAGLRRVWKEQLAQRNTELIVVEPHDFELTADGQRVLPINGGTLSDFATGVYVPLDDNGHLQRFGMPMVITDDDHPMSNPKCFGVYRETPITRAAILVKSYVARNPDDFVGTVTHEDGHDREMRGLGFFPSRLIRIGGEMRSVLPVSEAYAEACRVKARQVQFAAGDMRKAVVDDGAISAYNFDRVSGKVYSPWHRAKIGSLHRQQKFVLA